MTISRFVSILAALVFICSSAAFAERPLVYKITISVKLGDKPEPNAVILITGLPPNPRYEHTLGVADRNGNYGYDVFQAEELCFRARTQSTPVRYSQHQCFSEPFPSRITLTI